MFDSGVFDYVDVLGKAADASWTRNEIISNNMSNVNTPGYKRQDIDFESRLRQALGSMRYESPVRLRVILREGYIRIPPIFHIALTAIMWILIQKG